MRTLGDKNPHASHYMMLFAFRRSRFLHTTLSSTALALLLASCGGGGGGGGDSGAVVNNPPAPPQVTYTDPTQYSSAANASLTTPNEIVTTTRASLTLGGVPLAYTATAGHLTALALNGNAPQASFFYVAYTLDNAAAATRPVTFFYNGGPGSASVWLHLGSFSPKRLVAGHPNILNPPFALVDNAESLLDVTDMVFVDAVGSGYSQAIAPNTNRTFWGVDADAAVFRDFVRRYLAVNGRTASPLFLYGESYGGPRSAVLAYLLEAAGTRVAGTVLQSPAMDYNSNCGVISTTTSCAGYLPSYGATGQWHARLTPNIPATELPAFLTGMRTFAVTQYDPAVRTFLTGGVLPGAGLITQLTNTTGVPAATWQNTFNLQPGWVWTNLVPGQRLGRYDSRVMAANGSILAQGDPSSTSISTGFANGLADYLGNTLRYTTPSTYVTLSNAIDSWNFSHDGKTVPDTIPDLAAAMAINPRLKVMAVGGHHDLATPFYQTELDLARLPAGPNVVVRTYNGGHMTFLDDTTRVMQKADLAAFYRSVTTP